MVINKTATMSVECGVATIEGIHDHIKKLQEDTLISFEEGIVRETGLSLSHPRVRLSHNLTNFFEPAGTRPASRIFILTLQAQILSQ